MFGTYRGAKDGATWWRFEHLTRIARAFESERRGVQVRRRKHVRSAVTVEALKQGRFVLAFRSSGACRASSI
jgi:hypothetical protein